MLQLERPVDEAPRQAHDAQMQGAHFTDLASRRAEWPSLIPDPAMIEAMAAVAAESARRQQELERQMQSAQEAFDRMARDTALADLGAEYLDQLGLGATRWFWTVAFLMKLAGLRDRRHHHHIWGFLRAYTRSSAFRDRLLSATASSPVRAIRRRAHDFEYIHDAHCRRDYRAVVYPGFAYLEAALREGCLATGLLHRRLHHGRMRTGLFGSGNPDLYNGMGKLETPLKSMGTAGSVRRRIGTDWATAVVTQVNAVRKAVEHCDRPSAVNAKLSVSVLLSIAAAVELFNSPE